MSKDMFKLSINLNTSSFSLFIIPIAVSEASNTNSQIAHVCVDRNGLERLHHLEAPPDEYYEALLKDMLARHPDVPIGLIEHLVVVEQFLDTCIISGFALGAKKTKGRIA